jgi:poly(3-hydroxybutyrate) depolymerase
MDIATTSPSARRRRPVQRLALLLTAMLVACARTAPAPAPLPALDLDASRVAVAGLSSGAYMATQVHLALNRRIHGAALLSGGPYGCAEGVLQTALDLCMVPKSALPDAAALVARARERIDAGTLDPVSAFDGDRVWILHGAQDTTVAPAMAGVTRAVYAGLAPSMSMDLDAARPFGHVLPTVDRGIDCVAGGSPWIGRCGYDGAGAALQALFDAPTPADAAPAGAGTVHVVDQRPWFDPAADPVLADEGYLYVPPQCTRARCGLLVVFHGCQQSAAQIGRAFVDEGGFNRAADANAVVVLYPQTRATWVPLNPKACWDWWGYTGPTYDTRDGAQIRFVARALDALLAKSVSPDVV